MCVMEGKNFTNETNFSVIMKKYVERERERKAAQKKEIENQAKSKRR